MTDQTVEIKILVTLTVAGEKFDVYQLANALNETKTNTQLLNFLNANTQTGSDRITEAKTNVT